MCNTIIVILNRQNLSISKKNHRSLHETSLAIAIGVNLWVDLVHERCLLLLSAHSADSTISGVVSKTRGGIVVVVVEPRGGSALSKARAGGVTS